jgi:thiamine biosynthesis lipoprotein
MGTVFTIDIRDEGSWADATDDVVRWLHRVDTVFSTYRPDSDISRLDRGDLRVRDADGYVREVLDLCADVTTETIGYFSAVINGRLDPSGLVKGWAIELASDLLRAYGSNNHTVNGGGDMQIAGEAAPGQPWRVGIVDPQDQARLLTVVNGRDIAVATSGVAERGAHIVNPFTGVPAAGVTSVTVVGPSLTRVDAYATAAFVMGDCAGSWVESLPGYEALIVPLEGPVTSTSGFPHCREPVDMGSLVQLSAPRRGSTHSGTSLTSGS